jgi:signal peptidase
MNSPSDGTPPRDDPPEDGEEEAVEDPAQQSGGPVDDGPAATAGGRDGNPRSSSNDSARSPLESDSERGPDRPGTNADGKSPGIDRTSARTDAPPARRGSAVDEVDDEREDDWAWEFLVDLGSSALAVLLVGLFVFAISGVWPPLVAVESGSMDPHMQKGDLVFVMENERFPGEGAQVGTGVVTARQGEAVGYRQFGGPGDVVVYEPDGNGDATPIIHRAMFWVEEGERWYDEADPDAVGEADSCAELTNCPAPHAGFITKGDANPTYDQVGLSPHSSPVRPAWVVGTAEMRIPEVGCLRLPNDSCELLATSPGVRDTLAVDI